MLGSFAPIRPSNDRAGTPNFELERWDTTHNGSPAVTNLKARSCRVEEG